MPAIPNSIFARALRKSPWVFHVGTSGCNNCDIEIADCLTPRFDVERFGIRLVGSPRHADVMLISGPVSRACREVLQQAWLDMPEPARAGIPVVISLSVATSLAVDLALRAGILLVGRGAQPKPIVYR